MTKQELVEKMREAQAWVPGKRVKLDFGSEGPVLLDGASQSVSEEDGAADTTRSARRSCTRPRTCCASAPAISPRP